MAAIRSTRLAIYRKRIAAVLIATQIAVTLAILTNVATIVVERLSWSTQPTGIDEANIFFTYSENIETETPADLAASKAAGLAALRAMPGIVDAFPTNSFPLQGGGWSLIVNLTPDQKTPSAMVSYYFGDEHALNTFGLKLIAGRNFTASDVVDRDEESVAPVGGVIVTLALAKKLFPKGGALGKPIYIETVATPVLIIGIVDRLQGPFVSASGYFSTFAENSVIAPYRLLNDQAWFAVRTKPGQLNTAMQAAQAMLARMGSHPIVKARPMIEVRAGAYRSQRGLALLLAAVALILVAVTTFGMVGLTSYWVSQRRRQIGVRRALGATRLAILRYFQKENLAITAAGVGAGCILAIALNIWLVNRFAMVRIGGVYLICGSLAMLLLGQIAVFWPASRAMEIPPATAARGG
ncbi:MAG TPA: FtsX-like permease family protein [Steroidobacteraceae bacterium]|nr:FtsX-like permease family protein [Steroidobacteraceae bacterium]